MWISALVTLLNLALAATVGVRLLWRTRGAESGPEVWLAGYFLCGAFFGSMINITVYSSLGPDGLSFTADTAAALLTVSTFANGIAGTCVYVFTWQTFRARDGWAKALVAAAACAFAACWVYQLAADAFAVVVIPGAAYWIERSLYCGSFVWVASESWRYWGAQRKRLRIGLADPVVANRFALWGAWSSATAALAFSDLAARVAYVWSTGETTVVIVEKAMPIIVVTVAITAIVGAVAAASLWLTFFPTRRYLGWIEARHASRAV